jgi:hypothetical protein
VETLERLFGPPHEALHRLALRLIGRRAVAGGRTYVDIPPNLTRGQYVFVAGLPALVFWGAALFGLARLLAAPDFGQAALWFGLMSLAALAGLGTLGDVALIVRRLREPRP